MPGPHSDTTVAVRLPGGRLLIANLDPHTPPERSPLQRALRTPDPTPDTPDQ